MLYRLYQPGDFAALYAIEELCFEPSCRFSRTYMRHLTQSHDAATWIAEEAAQLLGFAVVEWSQDTHAAYIQTVEVTPGRRGEGIGGELLRRVEGSANTAGARAIWLHVDTENSAAIQLYESRGYSRQGREEHYYARNRAAFVYRKTLENDSA